MPRDGVQRIVPAGVAWVSLLSYRSYRMATTKRTRLTFKGITAADRNDITLLILDDGRELWVPTVVYSAIRESAFNHGVEWAWAHLEQRTGGYSIPEFIGPRSAKGGAK
jgi:hypothetical protein